MATIAESDHENPFHRFFEEGNVGRALFQMPGGIRSYLTTHELVDCAKTGPTMHRICRTYTVHELLQGRELLPPDLRLLIDEIKTKVTQYAKVTEQAEYEMETVSRPSRVIQQGRLFYWTQLFHPNEKDLVTTLIENYLAIVPLETLRLVSAYFGPDDYDVTPIVQNIVNQHNGRLVLQKPRFSDTPECGVPVDKPATFRWWYIRIFGDPLFRKSKLLHLQLIYPGSGKRKDLIFSENEEVDMSLLL